MLQLERFLNDRTLGQLALLALTVPVLLFLVACGDGDKGLSRAEVEEIVRAEMAEASTPTQHELGLTSEEVEEAIRKVLADMPEPDSGLSKSEVEEIINAAVAAIAETHLGLTSDEAEQLARGGVGSIPPKSSPAEYTKFFVNNAISRYQTQGLEATLAYYNREESIDGQWYVFIIDENDLVIAHPDLGRLGLDLKGWVGTDANGYNFGPDLLSATEEGKWVFYVYQNPESGSITPGDLSEVDLKNAWVVGHDGLLFASGWYIDVDQFSSSGLDAMVETLSSNPGSILGGVAESAVSYNTSGAVEGEWSVFIADSSGSVVLHFNPAMIGKRIEDLLGADASTIDEEGVWLTSESMRIWAVRSDGWVFGAGWRNDQSGS